MKEEYPDDWSKEDIAAAETDTPSWQPSDTTGLSDDDIEELSDQLNKNQAYSGGGETKLYREKHQS